MIRLKKLNGKDFTLNCELIESVENNPDTTITLISGKKLVVLEEDSEIIEKIIKYKRNIYNKFTVEQ